GEQAGSQFNLYLPGDSRTIFSNATGTQISPRYPLAEGYFQRAWPAGTEHFVQLRVTAPASGRLDVYARVAVRTRDNAIVTSPAGGAVSDQQGFPVLVKTVNVAAQATATAPPSPTPPRSPTARPTSPPVAPTAVPTLAPASSASQSGSSLVLML